MNQRSPYYQTMPRANSRLPKKKKHRIRNFFRLVVVGGLIFLGVKYVAPMIYKTHGKVKAAPAYQPKPVDEASLASQINQIINQSNLEVGVSITDLTNNHSYDYGLHNTSYIAASTTKMLSATLFLHDVEEGKASLSDPLGTSVAQNELEQMIVVSDNNAWQDFNDYLGHPALLQYAQTLGIQNYNPENNTITADDLAILFTKLYEGKLLNPAHTQLLLGYMARADYTQYIEQALPSGVKIYHKAGYLDDRAMDAAIIDNGKHPYVLVIFTKDPSGSYDQENGQQVFHSITTATMSAFAQ